MPASSGAYGMKRTEVTAPVSTSSSNSIRSGKRPTGMSVRRFSCTMGSRSEKRSSRVIGSARSAAASSTQRWRSMRW